ncbi:MAG: hypothetical protein M0036_01400 [Desulfobacteraceae bacterium]|nr:hypothetical protein [Desulfobacteraceae bacterium]
MQYVPTIRLMLFTFWLSLLYSAQVFAQVAPTDLADSYRFLVSDRSVGGALYTASAGVLKGRALPLSFLDSSRYWGEFVCRQPGVNCAVTDIYNHADYTLKPAAGPAADLQTERVYIHNGINIYDGAVWQIAVVLGQVVNGFGNPHSQDAHDLANNQNLLLREGYSGDADTAVHGANRAVTQHDLFIYNGHALADPRQAYHFRMIGRTWLSDDPFMATPYASLIKAVDLPLGNSIYKPGRISWSDWKPITGENAWAFLIGPLQAAYLHHVRAKKSTFIPFQDLAVQQALAVLPAFAAMQTPIGAVCYAPSGTMANQGTQTVNPHQVAVENNFSVYVGLNLLQATLRAELSAQSTLKDKEKRTIQEALTTIQTMIHGGQIGNYQPTEGLLKFFQNRAWRNGRFVQGGLANDDQQQSDWIPFLKPQAVDVNTWGVAALGARQIDAWFGSGAAFKVWQQVKQWGACGQGKALWGVGFSDQDGNGTGEDRTFRQGILSAEWTAGAIVMVRNMFNYYRRADAGDDKARAYVAALEEDEKAMLKGVIHLRLDHYSEFEIPGKPNNYSDLIASRSQPYLYASRRVFIPFGWYANPLPSTSATAWIILVADGYDPFGYGGVPN